MTSNELSDRMEFAAAACSRSRPRCARWASGAALLWTLEQGLGAEFTPEVKAAWTETYTALAGVMTAT
jgi:hypothetical protein